MAANVADQIWSVEELINAALSNEGETQLSAEPQEDMCGMFYKKQLIERMIAVFVLNWTKRPVSAFSPVAAR